MRKGVVHLYLSISQPTTCKQDDILYLHVLFVNIKTQLPQIKLTSSEIQAVGIRIILML